MNEVNDVGVTIRFFKWMRLNSKTSFDNNIDETIVKRFFYLFIFYILYNITVSLK